MLGLFFSCGVAASCSSLCPDPSFSIQSLTAPCMRRLSGWIDWELGPLLLWREGLGGRE